MKAHKPREEPLSTGTGTPAASHSERQSLQRPAAISPLIGTIGLAYLPGVNVAFQFLALISSIFMYRRFPPEQ